tara:strand:+ start:12329 stop:13393 length:1065 start_codon:yes stop_codon:yes gene_type:complete
MNISLLAINSFNIAIFIAVFLTFLIINLLRPVALRINLIDLPSNRKKHEGSVPLIGGISMFFAFSISFLLTGIDLSDSKYFLLASFVIVTIGALDDYYDISVRYRLFFQILAATIVTIIAGVNIESLGTIFSFREEILLSSWSVIVTIIAVIVAINAINMSDGINGLSGSISFVSFFMLAFFSYIDGKQESLIIASLMCSVILPFLYYNLSSKIASKKIIFMGDAGSMFLGLGIVWLLVTLSQGSYRSFSPVIALWLFAIPLIDATSTVIRRILKGQSPFKPDLTHIHHVLIHIGFSKKLVLITLFLFSFFMALIGFLAEFYKIAEWKMFLSFVIIFIIFYVLKNYIISKNNIG